MAGPGEQKRALIAQNIKRFGLKFPLGQLLRQLGIQRRHPLRVESREVDRISLQPFGGGKHRDLLPPGGLIAGGDDADARVIARGLGPEGVRKPQRRGGGRGGEK